MSDEPASIQFVAEQIVGSVPSWVLRPVPVNAVVDEELLKAVIDEPKIAQLIFLLSDIQTTRRYDIVANVAVARIWRFGMDEASTEFTDRNNLLKFVPQFFTPRARARMLRHFAKNANVRIRRKAEQLIVKQTIHEVALPASKDADWDKTGWLYGLSQDEPKTVEPRLQARLELPAIPDVQTLRTLMGVRSEKQLGWMCLATDLDDGPYTSFMLPKRTGGERKICAPKWQLRKVQQQILRQILYRVPVHMAAHGFVPGRSTVTNAAPHVGSRVIMKFDLQDFFPSIHHYRVVGLFASLGYDFNNGLFRTFDGSNAVAAVLGRLCMYTPNHRRYGEGFLPQGAPSSPAITNLICRALDARLTGLAEKNGGRYTRYADDLTFSFAIDDVTVGRFRWWVDQICHQEGFRVNQKKFRVIRRSQKQSVTGIVVNDCLRIPRRQRRQIRAILHNCRVHGFESQERRHPGLEGWLRGFASYIYMVHPEEGTDLHKQIDALLGPNDGASR